MTVPITGFSLMTAKRLSDPRNQPRGADPTTGGLKSPGAVGWGSSLVVVGGNRRYSFIVIGSPKELSYSNWQVWHGPLIRIFFWHFLYFLTASTPKSRIQISGGSWLF